MEVFLSSLQNLGICAGMVALGIFAGSRQKVREREMPWLGKFQTGVLFLLILALGVRIGADEQVVSSLGTIGLSALVITLLALAGSVLAVMGVRKLLGLDRQGRRRGAETPEEEGDHD